MAAMKSEPDGKKHPASHYLVVPDPAKPSTWSLRYKDAEGKIDRRLCGACYAALTSNYRGNPYEGPSKQAALAKLKAIYKRMGWPLPDAKMSADDTTTLEVEFSADEETEEGDDLLLSGRLFKSGNYPDKAFELTPEELYQSIASFLAPVPFDLEHKPVVFGQVDLTGAFGQIEKVWADDTGEWMMATARKPKWLHTVMPETRVSATFTRDTKDLIGAAWTSEPRVSGAELVAAFAATRHDTPHGQMAMQRIHDVAAESGAVCKRVGMASRHESKGIQEIHDTAVSHGAKCASLGKSNGSVYPMFNDDNPFDKPLNGTAAGKQPRQRSLKHMDIKSWLLGKAKEEGVDIDDAELEAAFNRQPDPKVGELETSLKAKDAEIEALRKQQQEHAAQFARAAQERREAEAVTFASRQIQAHRITPASQEKLAALHARVTASDSTAQFADGEKSTAALLQEFIDSLPDLKAFTTEHIRREEVAALFNEMKTEGVDGKDDGKPNQAMVDAVLASTPQGRLILAERQKNGNK